MKKLEDAVRRFGTPDHGRTAKRLRDFEAALVTNPLICSTPVRVHEPCCEFMKLDGSCNVHETVRTVQGTPWPWSEAYDKSLQRHRSVIQSLQVLLNQKDEEIDMLRAAPPVRSRDLWIAAGLVSLVLLSAYYGFM